MQASFRPGRDVVAMCTVWSVLLAGCVMFGAVALTGAWHDGFFVLGGCVAAAALAPVARMKCIVTSEGFVAQNYFRSHRVRWNDLAVIALMPGGLLPGGRYTNTAPECTTRAGDRFWISALTNASVADGERFRHLIEEQARFHGFDARVAWGYAR